MFIKFAESVFNLDFQRGFPTTAGMVGSQPGIPSTAAPPVGYFVASGLMIEATPDASYQQGVFYVNPGQGTPDERSFSGLNSRLGLNLRYYPKPFGSLLPFVIAGIGYQVNRRTSDGGNFDETINTENDFFYQGGIGLSYLLSPNVALDGSRVYRSTRSRSDLRFNVNDALDGSNQPTRFNALQLEVGLRFFLPE
jgi:opacity protein-like surface antigen